MTSPSDSNDLGRAWAVLGETRDPLRARAIPGGHLGVDNSGRRHLLVALGPSDRASGVHWIGLLTISTQKWIIDGIAREYLDIVCGDDRLFDLFDDVILTVLARIHTETTRPAQVATTEIERWRSLLAGGARRGLSEQAQRGLYAELYTLLAIHLDDEVIDSERWRGPLKEAQDIAMPGCHVEVKSLANDTEVVRIHGISQLDTEPGPIALALVKLAEDATGTSLPALVDQFLDRVQDRNEANRLLRLAGYTRSDIERYSALLVVTSFEYLEVDSRTPRITPYSFEHNTLPAGVSDVGYTIALAELVPLVIGNSEDELLHWVREQ